MGNFKADHLQCLFLLADRFKSYESNCIDTNTGTILEKKAKLEKRGLFFVAKKFGYPIENRKSGLLFAICWRSLHLEWLTWLKLNIWWKCVCLAAYLNFQWRIHERNLRLGNIRIPDDIIHKQYAIICIVTNLLFNYSYLKTVLLMNS